VVESFLKHYDKVGGSGVYVKTPTVGQIPHCFVPSPYTYDDPYTTLPAGGNENGNDTVGFWIGVIGNPPTNGMIGGTSGLAFTVEFTTSMEDAGRHICFDTNTHVPHYWEWAAVGYPLDYGSDFPTWDNGLGDDSPRCWELCSCANMPPEWASGNEGVFELPYCQGGSYTLYVDDQCTCSEPAEFYVVPPYNETAPGWIDNETGAWTCEGSTVAPGTYDIPIQAITQNGSPDEPFTLHVAITAQGCNCCSGGVGDANGSGDEIPTIGDVSMLIDHLFVNQPPLECYPEADINQSGGAQPLATSVTIGDITMLIDYLFVSDPQIALPDCLQMN
jgi:hypothetical protein